MEFPRVCPARLLSDQKFGMCITPHDYLFPFYEMNSNYYRPWKWYSPTTSKEFGSTIENDKGNFKITLDVQHFRPDEINVKVTANEIIVEGKHEERADTHGFVMRHLKRRYVLPNQYLSETVMSTLSSDGVLIITAEKNANEKIVPIKLCGVSPRKTQIQSKLITEIAEKELVSNANNTLNQMMSKEEHSRLLKPELLKEAILDINGNKIEAKMFNNPMKTTDNIESNLDTASSKLEESLNKSNWEMSELAGKMGQKGFTTSSEMSGIKKVSETSKEVTSSSYKSSMSILSTTKTSGKAGEYINEVISAELRDAAEKL